VGGNRLTQIYLGVCVWRGLINEVNRHLARLALGWVGDRLRAGKPSRYVTSHPGQLSLPSFRGR